MNYVHTDSPVGRLLLAADDAGLRCIGFSSGTGRRTPDAGWRPESTDLLNETAAQLSAYFAGRLEGFDLPLSPVGTAFQRDVWDGLREIPYGSTISYRELARRVGRPKAARAVGSANGRNPLPIVIPCHRVIASDGSLGGFGGGIEVKQALLDLEAG